MVAFFGTSNTHDDNPLNCLKGIIYWTLILGLRLITLSNVKRMTCL